MARQLSNGQVWAFEGIDEKTILKNIIEWMEYNSDIPFTIFSITFDRLEKEGEGEGEGEIIGYLCLEK